MIADDIIYLLLLIASIGIAAAIRTVPDLRQQQLFSTAVGLLFVFLVSGGHIIHPLLITFVNAAILFGCKKRYVHIISFVFSFLYLAFFRTTEYFGFSAPPAHTNAIQMILTLKLIGLAFEVHQTDRLKKEGDSLRLQYEGIQLTFADIIHYSFCFAGVLIGPYYKYRTYYDSFHLSYAPYVPRGNLLKRRIWTIPVYLFLFAVSQYIFPLEYAVSKDMLDEPLWYRIFYMTPIFFSFRMRIYVGFILGECVCIMFGIGAYPSLSSPQPGQGPTNLLALKDIESDPIKQQSAEYNFEAIHNIDEYGSEFKPTIRDGIKSWNRTVQYWLAMFIYKKLPFPKPVRITVTMLASSFWHGVHPGYYLCLLSAPLFLLAEAQMEKAFRNTTSKHQSRMFDFLWWIFKMQSFSYMGMAFLLLHVNTTLFYWSSIYFIGHIFVVIFYLLGYYINNKSNAVKIKDDR